jgi:N-carbamoyl-L-amino-acid hydrolase
VRELSLEFGGSQVGTVGSIQLSPNLINVIAREAVVTVDLRNTDDGILRLSEDRLNSFLDTLRRDENVEIDVRILARFEPVTFDESIVDVIEQVGHDFQVPVRRMTSGAGHDAQMMARLCPSAMIFVPSIGGVSHNPREQTSEDDLELGANVLIQTLLKLTER